MKFIKIVLILLVTTTLLGASRDVERPKNLNNSQKKERAEGYITSMKSVLKEAYAVLKSTRKEKDIAKLNCVNDNIRQINGLLKRSKEDLINMSDPENEENPKTFNHYFTKIFLAYKNVGNTKTVLMACSGSMITYKGARDLEVQVEDLVIDRDYIAEERTKDIIFETAEEQQENVLEPVQISPYF